MWMLPFDSRSQCYKGLAPIVFQIFQSHRLKFSLKEGDRSLQVVETWVVDIMIDITIDMLAKSSIENTKTGMM
ncbi:hypothetical protein HYFRA_00007367 [Hymenoscyphus fraxineus]|uniref:Uncharacterized protein n=1 Tax=Hymenoscyphus fraxineus TaxID=746836 RepID=A0A9N9KQU8_9HELO|nr:hypothetical protein HYFRA_00007367 [Hymenoscyphus fraxineus]